MPQKFQDRYILELACLLHLTLRALTQQYGRSGGSGEYRLAAAMFVFAETESARAKVSLRQLM